MVSSNMQMTEGFSKTRKCSKYTQDKLLIETKREAMNELGLKGPVLLLSNEIIQSPL